MWIIAFYMSFCLHRDRFGLFGGYLKFRVGVWMDYYMSCSPNSLKGVVQGLYRGRLSGSLRGMLGF